MHKLLGEFDNHFMMQHPDGSSFPIAKKGLSDDLQNKIRAMKSEPVKMSEGGVVPEAAPAAMPDFTANSTPAPPTAPDASADLSASSTPSPIPAIPDASSQSAINPVPPTPTPEPGPAATPALGTSGSWDAPAPIVATPSMDSGQVASPGYKTPAGPANQPDPLAAMPGYKESKNAIQMNAAAQSQGAAQMAKAQDDYIKQSNQIHSDYQKHLGDVDAKISSLSNDVLNGKVDPNRVWNNKSTGNKILASFAVMLGGLAGGVTGKGNAALDVLHKQIDTDIESQKADLGNKQNLLSHYMSQYHNIEGAENAARLHMATIAGAQLQKIAAQSGSAAAQAQAQAAIGQLKAQYAPLAQQDAMTKTLAASGPLHPDLAAKAIQYVVPKDQQGQAFKELDRVSYGMKEKDAIMSSFDQANNENTIAGRASHLGFAPASIDRLKTVVMPLLKDNEGKVNESEISRMDALIPGPGDSAHKIATKRQGFIDFINEKSGSSLLDAHGIKINPGTYGTNGANRFTEGKPN